MGLDSVEIVMEVEDRFGVRIPDDLAQECATIGELVKIVWSLGPCPPRPYRQVKSQIRLMVARQMGLRVRDVRMDSTWKSLGVD